MKKLHGDDVLGIPAAPAHLCSEARELWRKILADVELDAAGLALLTQGLEAFGRVREAQGIIADDGLVTVDRFGQSKMHPAVLIERDSRAAMLRIFATLRLDSVEIDSAKSVD